MSDDTRNSITITDIDDQAIRNSCQWIANYINEVVQLPIYEPGRNIEELDSKFSTVIFPKPLTYTHQLMRFLLEGTRDGMLALSQIFSANPTSRIPVAAIVRQIAEYSASAYYLSDSNDTAEVRIAKMLKIYRPSLNEKGYGPPALHELYDEVDRILNDWQSRSMLPKVDKRKVNTEAVKDLFKGYPDENLGDEYYRKLSGLTHASPRDLTQLLETTWRDNAEMQAVHYGESVADVAIAFRSAFVALRRAIQFCSGASELEIGMTRLNLQHFGLLISEMMMRVSSFWSRVPTLTEEAYESKDFDGPRLADVFKDGGPEIYDYLNELQRLHESSKNGDPQDNNNSPDS